MIVARFHLSPFCYPLALCFWSLAWCCPRADTQRCWSCPWLPALALDGCEKTYRVAKTLLKLFDPYHLVRCSLIIPRLVLHVMKLATDTGLTRFWWFVLLVLLLRIRRPPLPWICDKLKTRGGVLLELDEQLLTFCVVNWELRSLEYTLGVLWLLTWRDPEPVVDETWIVKNEGLDEELYRPRWIIAWLLLSELEFLEFVLELGRGEPDLADVILRIGWEQLFPSAQVESGQPHSNCFTWNKLPSFIYDLCRLISYVLKLLVWPLVVFPLAGLRSLLPSRRSAI